MAPPDVPKGPRIGASGIPNVDDDADEAWAPTELVPAAEMPPESDEEHTKLARGTTKSPLASTAVATKGKGPASPPLYKFDDDDERLDPSKLFEPAKRREETVLMPTAPRLLQKAPTPVVASPVVKAPSVPPPAAAPTPRPRAPSQSDAADLPPTRVGVAPAPVRAPQPIREPIPFSPGRVEEAPRGGPMSNTAFVVLAVLAVLVFAGGLGLFIFLR